MLNRILDSIDAFNERLGRITAWLAVVTILLASYNAVMGYLGRALHRSLTSNAVLELQWYLFSLIFLFGAAYGLKHDAHVRVDVLFSRLGARGKARINAAGTVLFLIPFCIFMLWASWPGVRNSWAIHEMSMDPGGLPRYPIKTALLVGFALLLLQAFVQLRHYIRELRRKEKPAAEEHHEHAG
ncbi:MAG TPA: TRAP transporter small permease subunit [Kiritimatiellia bacterium]|jgi:TRAP-type mannitol/chloroaromatic compound transport system permease small subunit